MSVLFYIACCDDDCRTVGPCVARRPAIADVHGVDDPSAFIVEHLQLGHRTLRVVDEDEVEGSWLGGAT